MSKSNERVLVGADTYIAGPYHFVRNIPKLVRDIHVAYIDSILDAEGEPMFSADTEMDFIDGEDDLAEVGLGDDIVAEDYVPAAHLQHEPPVLSEEEQAAADAMKAGDATQGQTQEGEELEEQEVSDPETETEVETEAGAETGEEAEVPARSGRKVHVGKGPKKGGDDEVVEV